MTTFTREQPKFGHNPARERNEVWARFMWAIDENVGTNLQAQAFLHQLSENTTAITFCKRNNFF